MSYYGDDDYDYDRERRHPRRPSPRRNVTETRRSQQLLNPNIDSGGLYRTRSQGHGPTPIVNVYTDVVQDNYQRSTSPYPPSPPSPRYRGRQDRLGDGLVDGIADLAIQNDRLRSRSRGRSDAGFTDRRDDYYEYEQRRRLRELEVLDDRGRVRREVELAEAKRKAEEQISKEEKKRIIDEYELKKREEEEERKAEEKRMREQIEREKIEKKEKEEQAWKDFLRKQKDEKEEEEAKEKKKEEEIDEALRKRLYNYGYTQTTVERIINEEKLKRTKKTTTTTTMTISNSTALDSIRPPTYAKIHRDYLSIDTLKYYGIPWEYDRKDKNYLIILREMDARETEALFDHTKMLRKGNLLLEPAKKEPQYAWYRKRDRSSSRVRKVGILKYDEDK